MKPAESTPAKGTLGDAVRAAREPLDPVAAIEAFNEGRFERQPQKRRLLTETLWAALLVGMGMLIGGVVVFTQGMCQ